jgi:hypothetical protein
VSGRDLGTAPVSVVLVRGSYRVSGAAGALSVGPFPVDLGAAGAEVLLDLSVPEALRPDDGPGLALPLAGRGGAIAAASAHLGLDHVVAVSLAEDAGSSYLVASLHDARSGALERECRVRRASGALPAGATAAIADFIVTGRVATGLVELPGEPPGAALGVSVPPRLPASPGPPRATPLDTSAPAAQRGIVAVGLRLGYAKAQGDVGGQTNMGEWIDAQVPVQLDLLVHLGPKLSLGAYGAYGFGRAGSDVSQACQGAQCSLTVLRAGLQARWDFQATTHQPWFAVGAGYEWNGVHREDGTQAGARDVLYRGLEWVNLQVGTEWLLTPSFGVGPYFMISGGAYDHVQSRIAGVASDGTMNQDFHGWFHVGIRGQLDL